MVFQEIFNDILSNLEYDNVPYELNSEHGKLSLKLN